MYQYKRQINLCQHVNVGDTDIRQQTSFNIHEVTFLFINSISYVKRKNIRWNFNTTKERERRKSTNAGDVFETLGNHVYTA